ncbi:sigma factor-like helix-turn-helix DNA-binding protein [Paenibacillus sp. MER TA 81-3]|uniref:sigma factor-like helix-turn-helix DNA-binding protein n=1 Tax=Paenibacillus sp. MER TA 81-3 TaxID=2939573 RepID=UPI00288AFC07|nr:sigma factor-like helix-turn-helix DNA-binding protein [Paenibacillus sp. MER TA 81-3]
MIRKDLLSCGLLVLLERLTPAERTLLVLREAFEFEYTDIAELLGKTEANCRKLLSRAREKMDLAEHRTVRSSIVGEAWVDRFVVAVVKEERANDSDPAVRRCHPHLRWRRQSNSGEPSDPDTGSHHPLPAWPDPQNGS